MHMSKKTKIKHYYVVYTLSSTTEPKIDGSAVIKTHEMFIHKTQAHILNITKRSNPKHKYVLITFYTEISKDAFMEYTNSKSEEDYKKFVIV